MSLPKPFLRTRREFKPAPYLSYISRQYIEDPSYARDGEHYIRAFLLIQSDLKTIFEYVEPSDLCLNTYSHRIHALFIRTCIEIEANFQAIFSENRFSLPNNANFKITHYRKIDTTHHLSSYGVLLPTWAGAHRTWCPFLPWKACRNQSVPVGVPLAWYRDYNASKHDRHADFEKANFENLIQAVAALLIVITAQFGDETFQGGPSALVLGSGDDSLPTLATGDFFRIYKPNDWAEEELYDFDWTTLRAVPDRFQRINYDSIP